MATWPWQGGAGVRASDVCQSVLSQGERAAHTFCLQQRRRTGALYARLGVAAGTAMPRPHVPGRAKVCPPGCPAPPPAAAAPHGAALGPGAPARTRDVQRLNCSTEACPCLVLARSAVRVPASRCRAALSPTCCAARISSSSPSRCRTSSSPSASAWDSCRLRLSTCRSNAWGSRRGVGGVGVGGGGGAAGSGS